MKKVKLGEICEIQAGGTPSRNKKEFWVQGNIPWVKIKDINSKYISKVEEREDFRQISYIGKAAVKTITGHGTQGYFEAIEYLIETEGCK